MLLLSVIPSCPTLLRFPSHGALPAVKSLQMPLDYTSLYKFNAKCNGSLLQDTEQGWESMQVQSCLVLTTRMHTLHSDSVEPVQRTNNCPNFQRWFYQWLTIHPSKLFYLFSPLFLSTSALGHLHHGQEWVHRDSGWCHPKTPIAQLQGENLDTGDAAASEWQIHPPARLRVTGSQRLT